MTKVPGIALYNQDRFGDAEFVASFVARSKQTKALLNSLRHIAKGGPTEHQILVGTRGMGKTSLLRRLSIGIIEDTELKAAFIPLRFREEQYNIISLDAFWRNCGESLAEYCEQQGNQALADRLDIAIETPEWRDDDQARDGFLAACKEAGGRAILFLDNLDLILEGIKDEGCWKLRAALQKADGPIVIGAATALLTQGANRDAPFYEFFHPHMLEPLTEQELLACLNALATKRGKAGAPVKAVLAREPERVRALYVLTGGNPRILGLVYGLLEQADSAEIFADLEALLDQVTPFYKARIEEYSTPLQRAVIDGIALNWDPITSNTLSKETGVESTTLSSQLIKLKKDGLIEEVETSGTRAGFQLAERFLNIWYLMRHGTRKTKQRLRWFTIFLTKLFNAEELEKMAGEARSGIGRWRADHCEAVIEAYNLKMLNRAQKIAKSFRLIEILTSFIKASKLVQAEQFVDGIVALDELIAEFGESDDFELQKWLTSALIYKGVTLGRLDRSEDAITAYEEVIARFGERHETELQEMTAEALVFKGIRLGRLGRSEEAIAVYEEVIARFGESDETELQELVANARVQVSKHLFWSVGRPQAAEAGMRTVLQRDPANAFAKANLLWMLIAIGRYNEASGLLEGLEAITGGGRALMQAGLELGADNLGASLNHLQAALDQGLDGEFDFNEDLLWCLRIANERGYGERVIDWFVTSGNADRYAPVYGAFVAHVRGERFLLDLNPEVRGVAQPLYAKLSAGKKHEGTIDGKKGKKSKR